MAKYIKLDKSQYGKDGVIPLKRGDDWVLTGKIVNRSCGEDLTVDLTGLGMTACLPGADGSTITVDPVAVDAEEGTFTMTVPKAKTLLTQPSFGTGFYIVLQDNDSNQETVESYDPALEIKDRGFDQE